MPRVPEACTCVFCPHCSNNRSLTSAILCARCRYSSSLCCILFSLTKNSLPTPSASRRTRRSRNKGSKKRREILSGNETSIKLINPAQNENGFWLAIVASVLSIIASILRFLEIIK